jgi:hypothetical protein
MENWAAPAQSYLARLGLAEYSAGMREHIKRGGRPSTYRYQPTEYHAHLCRLLGADDEHGFKALKLLSGYSSKLEC